MFKMATTHVIKAAMAATSKPILCGEFEYENDPEKNACSSAKIVLSFGHVALRKVSERRERGTRSGIDRSDD